MWFVIVIALEVETELLQCRSIIILNDTVREFEKPSEECSIIDMSVFIGEISESERDMLDIREAFVYKDISFVVELVVTNGVLDIE